MAYEAGIQRKSYSETSINETSSRSHLIFSVVFEISEKEKQVP
jgi:hypothetical protein